MNTINNSSNLKDVIHYLNNKDFDEALRKLEILSTEYPNNNLIIKLFASIYFKKKKLAKFN